MLLLFALLYIASANVSSQTLHYSKLEPHVLTTLEKNKCYEVDLHVTTYCNQHDAFYPVSQLLIVTGDKYTVSHATSTHSYTSREEIQKTTLRVNNETQDTSIAIQKGRGCQNGVLDVQLHYLKVYEKQCINTKIPDNILDHLDLIFIGSIFMCLMLYAIISICNDCCGCCCNHNLNWMR